MPQDKTVSSWTSKDPSKMDDIEGLKQKAEKSKIDLSEPIKLKSAYLKPAAPSPSTSLPWQKVQLSRHPDRPYTLKYIDKMTT